MIEYHESGKDVSGNTVWVREIGGAIPPETRRPWNGNTNRRPKAGGLYWLISGPTGEGGIAPQSLGIPRYVRARLMVFTLLLGKLKPSRHPREAIWVGNTYPLGGAKNFTMLQEVRIDPIRTPWEKLKLFTLLQEVRIDPIHTPWENSKVFIIVSRATYPGVCTS